MGLGAGFLGAVIGGLCGGPLGAVIGGGLGLCLFNETKNGPQPRRTPQGDEYHRFPIIPFFICLGKMAKSDGRVSQEEAAFIRAILKNMEITDEDRHTLQEAFRRGRDSEKTFRTLANEFTAELNLISRNLELRRHIMATFCSLVAVDHVLSPEEKENLLFLEQALGITGYVGTFFRTSHNGSENSSNRSAHTSAETHTDSLAESYAILGISATATDAEVKRAWHKKAQEFHPDHVQGAGLSQEFIDFAKKKMQAVNKAYETIRTYRGF